MLTQLLMSYLTIDDRFLARRAENGVSNVVALQLSTSRVYSRIDGA